MKTATVVGVDAVRTAVLVDVEDSPCSFTIVGLPKRAAKEAAARVRSAIVASGYVFPKGRITVKLFPFDGPKYGTHYDLPTALAVIDACQLADVHLAGHYLVVGELGLNGDVRHIRGVLAMRAVEAEGTHGIVCPYDNAAEAGLAPGDVFGVRTLEEAVQIASGAELFPAAPPPQVPPSQDSPDMRDVKGHKGAKRAMEEAAIKGTSILLQGAAASGKTMLARRFPTILPEAFDWLATARTHSVAGLLAHNTAQVTRRPFRAPHHTCSVQALMGGGIPVRPGEVSLAHNGVLFLDDLPEFPRNVIDALRQPLEEKRVTVARSGMVYEFPADFQLVAAANSCACGRLGSGLKGARCVCSPEEHRRYDRRVDEMVEKLSLTVIQVTWKESSDAMTARNHPESSETIRQRVEKARGV